ncbi:MAG: AmmeMemoRadiSam system radical SAM enzyme [Candidatus Anstonellales archaeon]
MKEAMLYEQMEKGLVRCNLCRRRCTIGPGGVGFCRVRKNDGGKLYTLNYGKCCAYNNEPIEKKPFYHFLPGTYSFSFAAVGCNFRCLHCQNWDIAQPTEIFGNDISPEQIVKMAEKYGSKSIAYTYTEPTIFFEYASDCAKIAHERGIANVFVTNGYMSPEAISMMEYVDAARVDLKAFNDKFYKEVCGNASLDGVLDSIKLLHKKIHVELIVLLIPTLNDSPDELRQMAQWIKQIDRRIPVHFTAYYPANKMTIPPTPLSTLQNARRIAIEEGLLYAYTGNIPGDEGENTCCPRCGRVAIRRFGFSVLELNIDKEGRCSNCLNPLSIVTKITRV